MAKSATKKEVIANYRADIARLLAAVAALGLERFDRPVVGEWSAKDVLAHIAAWDRALARGMQELLAGRRPEFASYVEDEFNARTIEVSRHRSFADVLADVKQAHAALVEALEHVTDQQWGGGSAYTWDNGAPMTIASVFDYRYKGETHYAGHAAEIETWSHSRRVS